MKIQTLTLGQLKDLYNADDCTEWKNRIIPYLKFNTTKKDDFLIEISWEDIEYAKEHYSKSWSNKKQLELLTKTGLKLEEECPYKVGDWININNKEINRIKEIKIINNENISSYYIYLQLNNSDNGSINYSSLKNRIRLATQEEIDYASIEWTELKTGSVVMIKNIGRGVIVLYNSNFFIHTDGAFYNSNQIDLVTLYYRDIRENPKYFRESLSKIKDLITKVISY